jgi:hypothetical protein
VGIERKEQQIEGKIFQWFIIVVKF